MSAYEIIMIIMSVLGLVATLLGIVIKLLIEYINAKK